MNKLMDLLPFERYMLIGKLVDAIVYDAEALQKVQALVEQFEAEGKIKSTFFPDATISELKTEEYE